MPLIIHPDPNADSFLSVVDATSIISILTLDKASWESLTDDVKENYLRISYRIILDGITKTVEADAGCLKEVQALMASHDLKYGISSTAITATTGAIKKQQVGQLVQEFYEPATGVDTTKKIDRVPDMAKKCLASYGFSIKTSTGGLKQTHLGKM